MEGQRNERRSRDGAQCLQQYMTGTSVDKLLKQDSENVKVNHVSIFDILYTSSETHKSHSKFPT